MFSGPRYKWYLVALLTCNAALNYGDRTATSAVFPLFRAELHMSDVALAAIGSFFLWSYAIGSPLAGLVADRFSRSRLVVWSLTAWSVVTLLTGISQTANQLLGTRILLGFAECLYLPAAVALIADHHPAGSRATAMGIHVAGLNVGMVFGAALAGYMAEQFGWRIPFLVLGGIGLALAVLSHFSLRDAAGPLVTGQARSSPGVRQTMREIFRVPTYLVLLAEAMLVSVGTWMFANWLPLYYKETFHMSLAGAGFSGTFMLQVAATAGVAFGGVASDRIARRSLKARMLVMALYYFGAAPCLLTFLWSTNYSLVSLSLFLYSLLRAMGTVNEHPIMCDVLNTRSRSTAIGLANSATCLAGGIGIFVAGYLKKDFGLSGVFGGVSVIVAIAGLLTLAGYLWFIERDLKARGQAA